MGIFAKLAAVTLPALTLAGCGGAVMDYDQNPMPHEYGRTVTKEGTKPLQCAPYARAHSSVKIYGDAYTWWDQAGGKYPRGSRPEAGAVMVLNNYAADDTHAHVAVVRRLVSAREIRVDHANWLNDGSIYVNNPVEDVSQANDWSLVRVFNLKTGGWGIKLYPVQGFIDGDEKDRKDRPDLVAGGANGGTNLGATALTGEIN